MPASIHKLLIHGHKIIESMPVPMGLLSEEAQESRNKDAKLYRVHITRKSSRTFGNEGLLHMLLISSDPYTSSLRKWPKKKSELFPKEVLDFLLPSKAPKITVEESSDIESD